MQTMVEGGNLVCKLIIQIELVGSDDHARKVIAFFRCMVGGKSGLVKRDRGRVLEI